jgi:hypothetical protein
METDIAIKVQELPAILETAPEILMRNQHSKDKATQIYNQVNALIKEQGMNDVYDQQLTKFVNQCQLTITAMNERRKPITQTVDMIKKEFTSLESSVKELKDTAQGQRNAYATVLMAEQKKKEEEAHKKLEKDKEVIELKRLITISYKNRFSDILTDVKTINLNWFNALKLDAGVAPDALNSVATIHISSLKKPEIKDIISLSKIDLTRFVDGVTVFTPTYHNAEEVQEFAKDIYFSILPNFEIELEKEIALQKQDLLDKLPSKIAELEELALADVQETERLLEEKRKRELADKEKLAKESEEKKQSNSAAASVQAAGEKAAATVDATLFNEVPKVAESYEIKVTNRAAWGMIFQFWFEKEGKSLTDEKLEKYTLLRIKAFCEKWAKDNNELIKTPGISYEAAYKAK